jgi:hypothetical protein
MNELDGIVRQGALLHLVNLVHPRKQMKHDLVASYMHLEPQNK